MWQDKQKEEEQEEERDTRSVTRVDGSHGDGVAVRT